MGGFFDIHTHILPHTDDGSSSSAESLEMLCALRAQGAVGVVATPHFYAKSDEPERFLKRRNAAIAHLIDRINKSALNDGSLMERLPDIYIGAEVAFFNAMSNSQEIADMCLSGTKYMLVEMPFDRWTVAMLDELYELNKKQGITPILAHVDRYFGCFKEPMLDEMIKNGIKVQINFEAFLSIRTRRRALELLKTGKVHFLGSDSHNMGKRAPELDLAVKEIKKKLGEDALYGIMKNGSELMSKAVPSFKSRGKQDE